MLEREAFSALLINASLLLAMVLIYDVLVLSRRDLRSGAHTSMLGLGTGLMCITLMSQPWEIQPGLVFDTRSVLLSMAGFFFNPLATVIAMGLALGYRILQGGVGTVVGCGVIVTSGVMGIVARRSFTADSADVTAGRLLSMGVLVHFGMLSWMFLLPFQLAIEVLRTISLPVMFIYPSVTVALGMLMRNRLRTNQTWKRLAEREAYNHLLFAQADLVLLVLDAETLVILDCNAASVSAAGQSDKSQLVGRPLYEFTAMDSNALREELERASLRASRGTDTEPEPVWQMKRSGEESWEAIAKVARFTYDQRSLLHVSLTDITATYRRQRELQQREERLRMAFTASNQGLFDLNVQTGQATVNEEYTQMLGFVPGEFRETIDAWLDRLHPDDRPVAESAIQGYLAGKGPESGLEVRQRSGQGDWLWVLVQGKIVQHDESGNPLRMLGTQTDISSRKRAEEQKHLAEEALRQSEARWRKAVSESPFPVMLHAEGGEVVLVSRAWCELTGYPAELLRTVQVWAELAYGDRKVEMFDRIQRLHRADKRVATKEFQVRTASGAVRTWRFSAASLGSLPDGRHLMISMAADLTEVRDAQLEVEKLNRELEERVRERTAQLATANEELEAFAYSVSHDLRAPLRAVDGFARIIADEYEHLLDDRGKHFVRRIVNGSERMSCLIDDLLQLSRVTRQPMRREKVDVSEVAAEAVAAIRASEPIEHSCVVIQPGMTAHFDRSLLRIVLDNLLENAWKFSSKRPIREIHVGMERQNDELVYFVRDNGVGFDIAHSNMLFAPFRRLHHESEFPGTGVGLATVHRIVQRHGGRIWPSAEPDRGATFFFTLGAVPE